MQQQQQSVITNSKPVIMIVDDDPHNLSVLNDTLADHYTVIVAEDGESAISRAKFVQPDLILMDIMMPGIDGYETCQHLKNNPSTQNIPIIFMTALTGIDQKVKGLHFGGVDYVTKPFHREELLARVDVHLRLQELTKRQAESNDRLEAIFASIQDGIVTIDATGNVTKFNTAARTICGISHESRLGSMSATCPGKCRQLVLDSLSKKSVVKLSRQECTRGNVRRIVSLVASPLVNSEGKAYGTVLTIKDETTLDSLEQRLKRRRQSDYMIGVSPKMQGIFAMLDDLAHVNTTVLVHGESGTGKELIADALHKMGPRKDMPLVKVNCAAINDELLESELFGHAKGAFSGAHNQRIGRFELANHGTIFLDEIGDISPRMQTRLLRVLQEREFERVGESKPIQVDVRIVAATNKDLMEKVARGDFREDLYYRLKVFTIELPPLKDRKADLSLLVNHFIKNLGADFNKASISVSDDVMDMFQDYSWPGNIRELKNIIEYAIVRCQSDVITVHHLPPDFTADYSIDTNEAHIITAALRTTGGNKAKTSRLLGIDRKTLYRKMEKLQIAFD